ncbi:MAG: hypothetical protein EA422_06000 [Gemmatimonadales bacterium]|nr:MAG: hypothetical protein EA422_06000 [Gemmatimonadales bacterium]
MTLQPTSTVRSGAVTVTPVRPKIAPFGGISRAVAALGFIFLLAACDPASAGTGESAQLQGPADRTFWTSYADVNWERIGQYDSEFHTHPGLGDEQYDPHETIDRYHAEGYRILTLAAHDYDIPDDHMESIYPWTRLSEIYQAIKDVPNPTEDNKTYGEMAGWRPYEDRDPVALGMVSVEGNEISGPHHMVSLFSSYTDGADSEEETLSVITELGGIVYFAHPGRYVERWGLTADWYVDLYRRFPVLIGQAIYNRVDNHPGDRAFFDEVVHILGADRPIWLFGEDDMHRETTLGWNRDVILLEDFRPGSMHPDLPDGSAPDVRVALERGHTYLWKPSEQYVRRAFDVVDIRVTGEEIRLVVDRAEAVDEIRWVTHDPELGESRIIHTGPTIHISHVPASARFVRAEISGPAGAIYLQPMYVVED